VTLVRRLEKKRKADSSLRKIDRGTKSALRLPCLQQASCGRLARNDTFAFVVDF
jgi:hypothetical protein